MVLILLISFIYIYTNNDSVKSSGFECGFDSFIIGGIESFSIPFFIISLLFLLFDVEIIVIRFPPFFIKFYFLFWFIIIIILFATCYEWMKGLLIWIFSFLYLVST